MKPSLHLRRLPLVRPLVWAAALTTLAVVPAQAQSLLQLYDTAHGFDAPYQSALANAQAAQARADQARAGLLPQVGLQMGAQRNWAETSVAGNTGSRSFNVLNGSVVGSQPLYRPANRIAWDQGKRAAEAAQVQLSGTEQDLIVRLSQAYFDVLAAEDSLSFVRTLKAAVAVQLEAAKRNFEVGNATITDSREAQARFDLATAQEIAAENDLRVKRLALDQLVGLVGVQPRPLAPSEMGVGSKMPAMSRPTSRAASAATYSTSGCTRSEQSMATLPLRWMMASWPAASTELAVRPWRRNSSWTAVCSMSIRSSGNSSSGPRRGSVLSWRATSVSTVDWPSPVMATTSPRAAATTRPPTTSRRCSLPRMKRSTSTSLPSGSASR